MQGFVFNLRGQCFRTAKSRGAKPTFDFEQHKQLVPKERTHVPAVILKNSEMAAKAPPTAEELHSGALARPDPRPGVYRRVQARRHRCYGTFATSSGVPINCCKTPDGASSATRWSTPRASRSKSSFCWHRPSLSESCCLTNATSVTWASTCKSAGSILPSTSIACAHGTTT